MYVLGSLWGRSGGVTIERAGKVSGGGDWNGTCERRSQKGDNNRDVVGEVGA